MASIHTEMRHLLSLTVRYDQDVVTARQRAVHVSQLLGLDISAQTRIATAVSEVVRNAFRYAKGGTVSFAIDETELPQRLVIRVSDQGPGILNLEEVLSGRYRSSTGMGLGLVGARRLMDHFTIESSASGTAVMLVKHLPDRLEPITTERACAIAVAIAQRRPSGLLEEIQSQNQELLRALDELQTKQQELVRLNRELEDTNRGVVALYAELDEKADHLRRADELKSRFLSNMTHEFRTPVNSIIGLSNLLLEDYEREGREPVQEVVYIRQAAEQLSEFVNDLLDLAKVEAGKTTVRPSRFAVSDLFGALRGMLRPLLLNQSVALVFEDVDHLAPLYTDEGKLSQILRNLISNALKFTERGEVRVTASSADDGDTVVFAVCDTGIGIAAQDQPKIFEEFAQLEHRLQRRVRGTGLGLPLSRRLAELLGGSLTVESELGIGSTFSLAIPSHLPTSRHPPSIDWIPERGKLPLLVIDDAPDALYLYEKILLTSSFQVYPARSIFEAESALQRITPSIIILDIVIGQEHAWDMLSRLRSAVKTSDTPIVVVSSTTESNKALALGADVFLSKPIDRRVLLNTLNNIQARRVPPLRVLVIDDEEVARFVARQCLPAPTFDLMEAASGSDGLARAKAETPDIVLLDLVMPELDGLEVLQRLRADPIMRSIPVIIVTSQPLDEAERRILLADAQAVVSKADLSRETLSDAIRDAIVPGSNHRGEVVTRQRP
jgi:signal transduction histidine kinase/DNA-binding response OmpR family regulator